MARIRSIHPSACTSEKLAAVSAEAERCYWRLLTHCDDEGRCEDHPRLIWAALFPLHESLTTENVDGWLHELHDAGLVVRYKAEGRRYLAVTRWDDFQSPRHPRASIHPAPPDTITPKRRKPSAVRRSGTADRRHMSPREGEGDGEGVGDGCVTASDVVTDFDVAWQAYPKRPGNSRQKALRAYQATRRRGVDPAAILAGVEAYAAFVRREGTPPKFIKHGATFFGPDEHWLTDYTPVASSSPADNARRWAAEAMEDAA